MTLNALLAIAFVVVGLSATLLMYHLWGYPYDAKRHVSAAPRGLTLLHRLLGLAFVAIYVTMLVRMVPRLWHYEGELAARTVLHVALACLIGVLLVLKIFIIRCARHFSSALPMLGSAVLVCAVVMLVMPLALVSREWWIARNAHAPDAQDRLATAVMEAADFFDAGDEPAAMIIRGRPLLHRHCAQCHDMRRIIRARRSPDEWISLVERMMRHARSQHPIPERDGTRIAGYLIAALGRDVPEATGDRRQGSAPREARDARAPGAALPAIPHEARDAAAPGAASPAIPRDAGAGPPTAAPSTAPPARDDPFADVRQILDKHCVICHSGPRAPKDARFETLEQILAERPDGPAVVVPGDPEASEMYRRIVGLTTPRMPITGPPWLSDEEIATIRAWIAGGAKGLGGTTGPTVAQPSAAPPAGDGKLATAPASRAPQIAGVTFAQVRPILAVNCMRCHTTQGVRGPAPEGLRLTDLTSVLESPERPVVISGNPGGSLLLRHVRGLERPRMPFDGPPWLTKSEMDLIAQWISEGARDDKGRPSPVPAGREVRLEGTLTAEWAVDGAPFRLALGGEVRDARIGRRVQVRAVVQPDGSLLARRVRGR